jgi:hypothetical protein
MSLDPNPNDLEIMLRLPIRVIGIVLDHKFYANDLEK